MSSFRRIPVLTGLSTIERLPDNLLQTLWAEPAVANPPPRTWRDWALVGMCLIAAAIEFTLRDDIVWPVMAVVLAGLTLSTLPWRRSHPFAMTAVAFGSVSVVTVAGLVGGAGGSIGLYTMAVVLVLPYALFRWASGRQAAAALAIMTVAATTGFIEEYTGVADAIGGYLVLLFPAVLGAFVRHLTDSRQRELADAKLREREQIARELHDTVAHHVSAIVIQARPDWRLLPPAPMPRSTPSDPSNTRRRARSTRCVPSSARCATAPPNSRRSLGPRTSPASPPMRRARRACRRVESARRPRRT